MKRQLTYLFVFFSMQNVNAQSFLTERISSIGYKKTDSIFHHTIYYEENEVEINNRLNAYPTDAVVVYLIRLSRPKRA